MRDAVGNIIREGDTVAVLYHPEAYRFFIERAVISRVRGQRNLLEVTLKGTNITASYYPDESGECYRKVVRVDPTFPVAGEENVVDAVGHEVFVGARVACRRPTEGGGNTVKGFDIGGKVVRITNKYVFFEKENGIVGRKGLNGIVVY